MKDIGRFKGGTGCQENQEKDRCRIIDLFIYLFYGQTRGRGTRAVIWHPVVVGVKLERCIKIRPRS